MKTSSRNIPLIGLATIGIAVLLISISAYAWFFIKIYTIAEQVELSESEARLVATQNDNIQAARRIVRSTQEEREALNAYFVTEEDIVLFIEDIEKIGEHAGALVNVQAVSVGKAKNSKNPMAPLYITLKSQGTLSEVYYTLALLEHFPKALYMSDVRITQNAADNNWQGVFDIVVTQESSQSN